MHLGSEEVIVESKGTEDTVITVNSSNIHLIDISQIPLFLMVVNCQVQMIQEMNHTQEKNHLD
jgi:hypothetical protein